MRCFNRLKQRQKAHAFRKLFAPAQKQFRAISPLESRGDRPLRMTFEEQLNALVYFHLEEFTSGRHLLLAYEQNDFVKKCIAPSKVIRNGVSGE